MFILKKLISAFLLPVPLCLTTIAVGLALLWFTKRQRAGKIVATVGLGLLTLFSYGGVARLFLAPLEEDHPPLLVEGAPTNPALDAKARQARWIVVLSGGHAFDRRLAPTAQLGAPTLARLVEGVRLKRQLPDAKLLV